MMKIDKKRIARRKREQKRWDVRYAKEQKKRAEKLEKLEEKMLLNPTENNIKRFIKFNDNFAQYIVIGMIDNNIIDIISTNNEYVANRMFLKMNEKADDRYKVVYKTSDSNTWKRILEGYPPIQLANKKK
jgi:hypothetical protein